MFSLDYSNEEVRLNYIEHFLKVKHLMSRMEEFLVKTECEKSQFCEETGLELYLKKDFRQITGSYHARSALGSLLNLSLEQKHYGVVTALEEDALPLCHFGTKLNIPVTIVLPNTTSLSKIYALKQYKHTSTRLLIQGNNSDEAEKLASDLATINNMYCIKRNDKARSFGYGTIGIEIAKQVPNLDVLVVPNNKTLYTSILFVMAVLKPTVKIIIAGDQSMDSSSVQSTIYQSIQLSSSTQYSASDEDLSIIPTSSTASVMCSAPVKKISSPIKSTLSSMSKMLSFSTKLISSSVSAEMLSSLTKRVSSSVSTEMLSSSIKSTPSSAAEVLSASTEILSSLTKSLSCMSTKMLSSSTKPISSSASAKMLSSSTKPTPSSASAEILSSSTKPTSPSASAEMLFSSTKPIPSSASAEMLSSSTKPTPSSASAEMLSSSTKPISSTASAEMLSSSIKPLSSSALVEMFSSSTKPLSSSASELIFPSTGLTSGSSFLKYPKNLRKSFSTSNLPFSRKQESLIKIINKEPLIQIDEDIVVIELSDEEIDISILKLFEKERCIIDRFGAMSLAAVLWTHKTVFEQYKNKRVVSLLTNCNDNVLGLPNIMQRALFEERLKKVSTLNMPENELNPITTFFDMLTEANLFVKKFTYKRKLVAFDKMKMNAICESRVFE